MDQNDPSRGRGLGNVYPLIIWGLNRPMPISGVDETRGLKLGTRLN